MTDPKISLMKGLRPAGLVVVTALLVGVASPDVMAVIKDSPIAAASIPLVLAVLEAGRNYLKPRA